MAAQGPWVRVIEYTVDEATVPGAVGATLRNERLAADPDGSKGQRAGGQPRIRWTASLISERSRAVAAQSGLEFVGAFVPERL
jgi:hypothetical protein